MTMPRQDFDIELRFKVSPLDAHRCHEASRLSNRERSEILTEAFEKWLRRFEADHGLGTWTKL